MLHVVASAAQDALRCWTTIDIIIESPARPAACRRHFLLMAALVKQWEQPARCEQAIDMFPKYALCQHSGACTPCPAVATLFRVGLIAGRCSAKGR
jgi:hypothetical protein